VINGDLGALELHFTFVSDTDAGWVWWWEMLKPMLNPKYHEDGVRVLCTLTDGNAACCGFVINSGEVKDICALLCA
jgi:hypothetical protein